MKLRDAMICWCPHKSLHQPPKGAQTVMIIPHPDTADRVPVGWSTDGACIRGWRNCTDTVRLARLLLMIPIMIIRDGVGAGDIHAAFLEIDEYRDVLPDDMPELADDRIGDLDEVCWVEGCEAEGVLTHFNDDAAMSAFNSRYGYLCHYHRELLWDTETTP